MNKSINEVSPGYASLSLDSRQFQNYMLFQAGFHRQKRIWVLGYLRQNAQGHLQKVFGEASSPSILFSLASFFLWRGFLSIWGQAKTCVGTLLYRTLKDDRFRRLSKNKES